MAGFFGGCTGYTYAYNHSGGTYSWHMPGGTANIFPSEYGVHTYDANSAVAGVSATIEHKDFNIADVSLNDTFESWRRKTNTEIIAKLNKLHVYGATPGDGIMLGVSTGGTAAIAFSGNVLRNHVTFCNNVYVGTSLKVADQTIGTTGHAGKIKLARNINENMIVLNHNESDSIGSAFSGFVIGGHATGADPNSIGADPDDAFVIDRPYLLHKNSMWRTKEGIWLEGKLVHQHIFTGLTGGGVGPNGTSQVGSTGADYPSGPYGYTGTTNDYTNRFFDDDTDYTDGGVVRIFFGPTLSGHNYLDIDGRGGRSGVTGQAWRGVAGVTGALVIGNTAGGLLEFDDTGFVNIYKGANKKRVKKVNHGFTFGHCIRYDSAQGFTFANAAGDNEPTGDAIAAADVIGVVSKRVDKDHFDLSFIGELTDTTAAWNDAIVESSASGLTPGKVYFLSPSVAGADRGRITATEPESLGSVNKPVLIATGTTGAIVLPYRGQYNSSTGCSGGVGGRGSTSSQRILFEKSYTHGSDPAFVVGDLVRQDPSQPSGLNLADNRSVSTSRVIGVVSYVSSTTGSMRVVTQGNLAFTTAFANSEGAGTYYLGESGKASKTPHGSYSVKVFDALSPTQIIINPGTPDFTLEKDKDGSFRRRSSAHALMATELSLLGPTGATGFTYDNAIRVNKNELINGNFGIWQRAIGTSGASGYTGFSHTYFADRWLRVAQCGTAGKSGSTANINWTTGASSGTHRDLTFALMRNSFDKKQIDVEGHPDFYATIRGQINFAGGTNNNEWYRVEQRMPDCTSFAGQVMTVSFYAKGGNTGNCQLAWTQNLTGTTGASPGATFGGSFETTQQRGVTASEVVTPITSFHLTKNWQKYAYSFIVPEISSLAGASGTNHSIVRGVSADHFAALAFYTQWTSTPDGKPKNIYFNHDLNLAQVKLERGNMATLFNRVDPNEELNKCRRFYQTSYNYGVEPGTNTLRSQKPQIPDNSAVHFLLGGDSTHVENFPVLMRKTPHTTKVYSPTGIENEGFLRNISKDMRFSAGTKGLLGDYRSTNSNSSNVGVTADAYGIEFNILFGAKPLDSLVVHYTTDADLNNAFPTDVSLSKS